MPAATRRRSPLTELPLSLFAKSQPMYASPVRLPSKRGPPTPSSRNSALQTPKRRAHAVPSVVVDLMADDLGTGKSPARRLFPGDRPHPSSPPSRSSTAAPSPPPASTAAAASASVSAASFVSTSTSASSSTSASTASSTSVSTPRSGVSLPTLHASIPDLSLSRSPRSRGSSMHDPGFVIFTDDDPAARPKFVSSRPERLPSLERETENVPPAPLSEPRAPATSVWRGRSRLGLESVVAHRSSESDMPSDAAAPAGDDAPTSPLEGKEALKFEVDEV